MTGAELPFRPDSFFERSGIDLILGDEARSVDRAAQRVLLASGGGFDYDELVLAMGAVPHLPDVEGADLSGVAVVRDRRHADELRERLPRCRSLVIVGGGFIGTEVAASVAVGREVTILERWPRFLMRSVSAPVAQRVREVHESHGVLVRTGSVVTALSGDAGRVRSFSWPTAMRSMRISSSSRPASRRVPPCNRGWASRERRCARARSP